MAAVARLLPPRPAPKSLPPTIEDVVHEVTDTCVNDVTDLPRSSVKPPPLPVKVTKRQAARPGVILARTIGFFVADLAFDLFRSMRAFLKAHWVRAAARARV